MLRLLFVSILCFPPVATFAASREIQEIQRDLSLLQQAVQQLQRTQDEKFGALSESVRQVGDAAARANGSVAGIQTMLQQSLREQEKNVSAPVVGLSTK